MVTAWPSCRPISAMVVMGDSVVVVIYKSLLAVCQNCQDCQNRRNCLVYQLSSALNFFNFGNYPIVAIPAIPLIPPPRPPLPVCHTPRTSCREHPLRRRLRSPAAKRARLGRHAEIAWSVPSQCRLRPATDGNHVHACCHERGWNEYGLAEY